MKTLFVPFLGQSNARYMSLVYDSYRLDLADNDVSGAIVLEQKLTQQINEDVVTSDTIGEADALSNTSSKNPLDREKYKQSTLAVFDYLRSNLDYADITFYIVPTGRFQGEAAINRGWSNLENIDPLAFQKEMANQ